MNYYRLRQVDLMVVYLLPGCTNFTDKGLQQVSVYPNPANEFIYITYAGNKDKITLSIYNVQERLISKQTVKAGSINKIRVHQLAKALYFIELTDGELIQTKKFIKQ
ncbi:MAG: T9SS type A sorting domain-containing protein [Chitinophagaceae bacterium]|nr:T9SS type A sorting domain-containing protein [Chitinophagaceae bacterium]